MKTVIITYRPIDWLMDGKTDRDSERNTHSRKDGWPGGMWWICRYNMREEPSWISRRWLSLTFELSWRGLTLFIWLLTNQRMRAVCFCLAFSWLYRLPLTFVYLPHLQCGWPLTHFLVEYFYWKRLLELHNYYCVN